MQKHIDEFKRDGYTVLKELFDRETTEQWKAVFDDLVTRQSAPEEILWKRWIAEDRQTTIIANCPF